MAGLSAAGSAGGGEDDPLGCVLGACGVDSVRLPTREGANKILGDAPRSRAGRSDLEEAAASGEKREGAEGKESSRAEGIRERGG